MTNGLIGFGNDITKVRAQISENLAVIHSPHFHQELSERLAQLLSDAEISPERLKEDIPLLKQTGVNLAFDQLVEILKAGFTIGLKHIKENPFKVNRFLAWMIELVYAIENPHDTPEHFHALAQLIKRKHFLSSAPLAQAPQIEKAAVYAYLKIFQEESPSDENYARYFAFTLRQTDVQQVAEFLKEKQADNHVNFHEFLQLLLIDFEDLIPPKILKAAQWWLDKQEEIQETPQPETEAQAPALPPGYVRIKGKLTDDQIRHFFSFLYKETNGSPDGEPFLKEEEVKRLLKYGFAYPLKEPEEKAFSLRLNHSKTEGMIYYCLFRLYQAHYSPAYGSNEYKRQFACFLKHQFEDFDQSVESLTRAIRGRRRGRMRFDIEGYLPGR